MLKDLSNNWRQAGICRGDTVLIHSDIKNTIRKYLRKGYKLTVEELFLSFVDAVGEKGTLLFPLFNFDFTSGVTFYINDTPSKMGALSEFARMNPYTVRTGHPIYSFGVYGHSAENFRGVDNYSGYGEDSPFGALKSCGAKIAVLDLPDQTSMTYYHHIEEMHNVDYRYNKAFTGKYVDSDSRETTRTYNLFVRDITKGVLTHVDPAGELLWDAGLYRGDRPKTGCGLRVIDASSMFEFVSNIIVSGKAQGLLYRSN